MRDVLFVVLRLDLLTDGAGVTVTARHLFESSEEAEAEAARLNGQGKGFQRYIVQSVRLKGAPTASGVDATAQGGEKEPSLVTKAGDLKSTPTATLLHTYASIVDELASRGMGDPYEPPGALWAETLIARYFKVASIPQRVDRRSGYDFETPDGKKVEVKTLPSRPNRRSPSIQLPRTSFDVLAVVILSTHLAVETALLVPAAVVASHGVASGGGARLKVTDALRAVPDVTDITADLNKIARQS